MSEWYYAHDGQQKGPVPISELQRLADDGNFDPENDLVWQEGLPDWKPASAVPQLSSLLPSARPAPADEPTPAASEQPSPSNTPRSTPAPSGPVPAAAGTPPNAGMAIGSMICGIVALVTCFLWCLSLPLAITAIVLGHLSMSRIRKDPSRFTGKGFARTGQITGYIGLVLTLLYTAVVLYVATRSPEQLQEMDWLPPEVSERIQEEMQKQRELSEP